MSAQGEGGRKPKPKGKTLGSFLGFLPGFNSARNLVANAQGPAREVQPVTDPAGAATPQATRPQAQATSPKQMAREVEMLPPPSDKTISGAKDLVCSTMTTTKDAISSGMANVMDSAKAQLVASGPEPRVPAGDQRSYFVRLGDLAHSFRQRAFEHTLSHLQHGQFQARATLALLEDSFSTEPDSEALSRTCGLIQQLHVAYSTLASGLQGLPAELQQRVRQARHSLCELYGVVSSASSITALPAERLAQSRESVGQAWQGLEKLLESVQHSPPLSWLVGPFDLHPGGQQL